MSTELSVVVGTVVGTWLVPFLKLGAEKFAEQLSTELGQSLASSLVGKVKSLWSSVKTAFSSEDQAVLVKFEQRPDLAQALVEEMIVERASTEPQLVSLFNEFQLSLDDSAMQAGARIFYAQNAGIVDMRNAHLTGNQRIVGLHIDNRTQDPPASNATSPED